MLRRLLNMKISNQMTRSRRGFVGSAGYIASVIQEVFE